MKNIMQWLKVGRNRTLSLMLAAVLVMLMAALGLASTLAAPSDLEVTFDNPYPTGYVPVPLGDTVTVNNAAASLWRISDDRIISISNPDSITSVVLKGEKAGIAILTMFSRGGTATVSNRYVVDPSNIVSYKITMGTKGGFIPGKNETYQIPITVKLLSTPGSSPYIDPPLGLITWSSDDNEVATVSDTGLITAKASLGAVIIRGAFTDPWGRSQTVSYLVLIGVNDSKRLQDLQDKLIEAETVKNDGNEYTQDSLDALQEAIDKGSELVTAFPDVTEDEIRDMISELDRAIGGMKNHDGVVRGQDGNWYRSVGRPANVSEDVNPDGTSKYPPEYVYNPDGEPGNGNDRPAYWHNGKFWVEDPEGSNIYKQVDDDGSLSDSDAIWGGPDGMFGGGDDVPAVLNEENGRWYADLGQNVYQEIDNTAPIGGDKRGQLTGKPFGAGQDGEPGTEDDLTPIYLHTDGKYYAGPYKDKDGYIYFVGDKPLSNGGTGSLDSSGDGMGGHEALDEDSTDQVYYLDSDGNMVSVRPTPKPSVTGVTISPDGQTVYQGSSWPFEATVTGTNVAQIVIWEVEGNNHPGTIINSSGMLAVSPDETAEEIIVRATSILDPSKTKTVTVGISVSSPQMTTANTHKISAGQSSFIIKDSGTLWGAGYNYRGQLGVGDTRNRSAFVPIMGELGLKFHTVSEYASGTSSHTIALTMDGRVFTWGYNYYGQLGDGSTTTRSTPVEIKSLGKCIAVAAGYRMSAAITEDGKLYTWGQNEYGKLGNGSTTNQKTPVLIQVGPVGTKVKEVSLGYWHSFAITEEGDLYSWGRNNYGQLGVGATGNTSNRNTPGIVTVGAPGTKIKAVAAKSLYHVLALTEDGDLYAWGRNNYGQLGDSTTTQRNSPIPVMPSTTLKIREIATGHYFSMALTEDGKLYAWGYNNQGQLGDGSRTARRSPVWITPGVTYRAMAAGELTSMAITEDGRLYLWGSNNYGQYGNGLTGNATNKYVPSFVPLSH